jgi:hypothetical protein
MRAYFGASHTYRRLVEGNCLGILFLDQEGPATVAVSSSAGGNRWIRSRVGHTFSMSDGCSMNRPSPNDSGRHVEVVMLRVHLAGIIFKAPRISRSYIGVTDD